LKIDHCKQKLPAKRAILKALREPLEPKNWCDPFFFSTVFYRVLPPPFLFYFIYLFIIQNHSVRDQNYIHLLFSLTCRNTGLRQTVHWGPLENVWILRHFREKGIDIRDAVKNVVGLGCETTQELRMKERNTTLDGFQKLLTDCILIYEGAVVATLLHELVLSDQASDYFSTMANMWEFGRCVTRTCSPKTRMAMFGHRFYYNNYVPTRSAYQP